MDDTDKTPEGVTYLSRTFACERCHGNTGGKDVILCDECWDLVPDHYKEPEDMDSYEDLDRPIDMAPDPLCDPRMTAIQEVLGPLLADADDLHEEHILDRVGWVLVGLAILFGTITVLAQIGHALG